MLEDPFGLLPDELIVHIVSFYTKRCWFVLSKKFYVLALEAMDNDSKRKAFEFACKNGFINLFEMSFKVKN
jgi:hypothetical protein